MAFQTEFLTALAGRLHTNGAATYRPAGGYVAGEVGLYFDQLATAPDRGIALSMYGVDDNTGTTDSTIGVQARIRGRRNNRADVKDIADALFEDLHDAVHYQLGGTPVVRSWQQSTTSLPPDGNNRQEATVNYYFQINRTSPHRRD
ncbi:minor capsid protein [Citricoccus sp.]|uniref:minor capsid protein n=1 Tax=Citricoccus sp. TaxID=1978372 RepID=UPI0028BD8719|nr:minor capsid protein [Citricoccus sp.]